MNKTRKTSSNLFKAAIILAVVLVLAGGAYTYQKHKSDQRPQVSAESGTVNLKPPSEDEKADTRAHEQAANDRSPSAPKPSSASKHKVTPIITTSYKVDADTYGVNGYVPSIVEDGGTCKLTLEWGDKTVIKSRSAVANVTNTTCGVIEVPYSSLSKGVWQATLSYSSSAYEGSSTPENIEVP